MACCQSFVSVAVWSLDGWDFMGDGR